ncbi:MAG: hypothetical protein LUQ69_09860 [Methanoregulaceae archaeon]|nr:hypothetical protein [Methanoregulaceae archaeon]
MLREAWSILLLWHTFAQQLVDAGVSIDGVGAALGHEPGSRQTQIYAQVRRNRVVKAIEALDGQALTEDVADDTPVSAAAPAKRKAKGARQKTASRSRKAV